MKEAIKNLKFLPQILFSIVLLFVFLPLTLWLSYSANNFISTNSQIETAKAFSNTVASYRTFYSDTIVNKFQDMKDIKIVHNYKEFEKAIPLPATFAKDFGKFYSNITGFSVKLYSDLPFPWNKQENSLDDFEVWALNKLKQNPDQPVWKYETIDNNKFLRYASADILSKSCVNCHNTYVGTPKTDWKVGDVRGVLAVTLPITNSQVGWWLQFGGLLAVIFLVVFLLLFSLFNLRKTLVKIRNSRDELEIESKQKMSLLKKLEAKISKEKSVFNSMNDVLVVINESGIIIETNNSIWDVFGYKPEELIGKNVSILTDPYHAVRHDQYLTNYYNTGEHKVIGKVREVNALHKNGNIFPVELSVNKVKSSSGKIFTGIIRDISEKVAANLALEKAHEQALESSKLKSQFLANMSHEIRTPMNGIIGMTQLMGNTRLDPEQTEFMRTINLSTKSLLRIVNDILDFSKMESGTYKIENEWFNLSELIEDISTLSSEQAMQKKLALSFVPIDKFPELVFSDSGRIRQVLTNLVHNAIKFTDDGFVLIRLNFEIEGDIANITITIEDSGIGIDINEQDKLFKSFLQIDGTNTRKHDGTGLGLAISKKLVELMGGSISVTSEVGVGSKFNVNLSVPHKGEINVPLIVDNIKSILLSGDGVLGNAYSVKMSEMSMNPQGTVDNVDDLLDILYKDQEINFIGLDADFFLRESTMDDLVNLCKQILTYSRHKIMIYVNNHSLGILEHKLPSSSSLVIVGTPIVPSHIMYSLGVLNLLVHPETLDSSEDKIEPEPEIITDKEYSILLVEDNEINTLVLQKILKKLGYSNISFAANGELGVEKAKSNSYDLIFMDCQMPVMDGFTATVKIRELDLLEDKHTTIVALTANALDDDRKRCLDTGMDDYLSKPIDFNKLKEILNKWVP